MAKAYSVENHGADSSPAAELKEDEIVMKGDEALHIERIRHGEVEINYLKAAGPDCDPEIREEREYSVGQSIDAGNFSARVEDLDVRKYWAGQDTATFTFSTNP